MNTYVAIQITSTVLCCLIQLSVQSSSYDMFQKYMEISRQASDEMERSCSTFSDCEPTECCVAPRRGASRGVCMKRPSLGDECGLSASRLSCPCTTGTTCLTYSTEQYSSRKHSFRCKYVKHEREEIGEKWGSRDVAAYSDRVNQEKNHQEVMVTDSQGGQKEPRISV